MTSRPETRSQLRLPAATAGGRGITLPLALRRHGPLLALLLAGLLLRLWFIAVSPLNPAFSNADDGDYYRRAMRLAVSGEYRDDFWLIRPPGTVFAFAAMLRLALALGMPEYGWRLVQLAQVALALGTAALGFDLARRLWNRQAGLLFAAFLCLWYPLVELSSILYTELLYTFLFTLHLWLLARFDSSQSSKPQHWWLFLAGLTLGAAALVRSPALYALAFVALWLVVRTRHQAALPAPATQQRAAVAGDEAWLGADLNQNQQAKLSWWASRLRQAFWPLLVFATGVLLVVAPWTLRNYLLYEHFIPVDTLGPINLWLDFGSPDDRGTKTEQLLQLPQADRQAYASARLREELGGQPWLLFKDGWENFRHVWKAQFAEDFLVKSSFFARPLRETWPLGALGDLLWLLYVLPAIAMLAAPPREGWHWRLLVLAWLGYSFLTLMLFHVEPRYLLPIWFLLGLYGAAALAAPRRLLADFRRVPLSGLLATLLLVATLWLIGSYRDYAGVLASGITRERAVLAGERSYHAGDYRSAEQEFRVALAAQPHNADVRTSLALAIAAQGRDDEAWQLVKNGGPRRTNLVAGHLARTIGQEKTARSLFELVEYTAGEDAQAWALEWLRPAPRTSLALGDNLDLGYISGFAPGERGEGFSFRWLEGQGRVVLPLDAPLGPNAVVTIRAAGGLPGTTPLTARFADGTALTLPVAQGRWRVYHLAVPAALAGQQRLALELRAPTFVPALLTAGSDDVRTLSLMISNLAVRP